MNREEKVINIVTQAPACKAMYTMFEDMFEEKEIEISKDRAYELLSNTDIDLFSGKHRFRRICIACKNFMKPCYKKELKAILNRIPIEEGGFMLKVKSHLFANLPDFIVDAIKDKSYAKWVNVDEHNVLAIKSSKVNEFLEKYNLEIVDTAKDSSGKHKFVSYRILNDDEEESQIDASNLSHSYSDSIIEKVENYIETDKPIVLTGSGSSTVLKPIDNNDSIRIHFYTSPRNDTRVPFRKYDDKRVSLEHSFAYPSDQDIQGIPIIDNQGRKYGIAIGNDYYIFINYVDGSTGHSYMLNNILMDINLIIHDSYDKHVEETNLDDTTINNFVDVCMHTHETQVEKVNQRVSDARTILSERKRAYTDALDEYNISRILQEQYNNVDDIKNHFIGQIKDIDKIKKVESVTATKNNIVIHTHTIFCRDDKTTILKKLGKYIIRIDPENKSVSWENKERTVNNWQAPHVYPDGHACLGNMSRTVPQLIAEGRFAEVVLLAIRFLEAANVADSAGRGIRRWPNATEKDMEIMINETGMKPMKLVIDENKIEAWDE